MRPFISLIAVSEELSASIALRVSKLRRDMGITQSQVAKRLGITQQAYARYEAGQRKIPIDLIPELANAFSISIEDLWGLTVEGKKRRGPASSLEKHFEAIKALPKKEQRFIVETLDRLLQSSTQ